MDYETAMVYVDAGASAERRGWEPEYDYYPNGGSAWYWVTSYDGKHHRCLGTENLGTYAPTEADLAANDWQVF